MELEGMHAVHPFFYVGKAGFMWTGQEEGVMIKTNSNNEDKCDHNQVTDAHLEGGNP